MRIPLPGIAGRVFLYSAAIVCAVLVAVLLIASNAARRTALDEERRGLEQAADITAQLLAGRGRSLAGGARVFVQGPYFRALVAARRRDDILDQAFEAADQLGADWVFITDERGMLLAKSDEPAVSGAQMAGIPLVAGALEGRATTGFGVSRDTLLFQAVAVPVVVPGAAPVGVLVATKLVDRQLALDIRAATGADVLFYTFDARGRAHAAASSVADASHWMTALPASAEEIHKPSEKPPEKTLRTAQIGGVTYALQGAAVTTAGGEVVGGFVVGRQREAMPALVVGVRRSLLVGGALGVILALLAAWSAARRVTRPVRTLADAAALALEDDYAAGARMALATAGGAAPAEIQSLGSSLAALLGELREKRSLMAMLSRSGSRTSSVARADGAATDRPVPAESGTRSRRSSGAGGHGRSGAAALALGRPAVTASFGHSAELLTAGEPFAGRYRLEEVLGSGGTGVVYRAMDITLGETIALKALRSELISGDPRAAEELKHELRLTRKVSHRNVVRTYDFGVSRGVPFLTMEYVDGVSLAGVLAERGALPDEVIIALASQLLRALEAAHEQGVMHGDLKPANLLVATDGLLKVTDFGVATLVRRPAGLTQRPMDDDVTSPPQLAGAVVGTPEYMAPELLLGAPPEPRTDLYAAGIVLQECLAGLAPFQRDTPRAFFARKLETTSVRAAGSVTPRTMEALTLEGLVAWMTTPEASDRPASAADVLAALTEIRPAGEPRTPLDRRS